MVTATTPSLAAYRTTHKIAVDDSGPLPVCAVDGIRIHPTRVGGWFHDTATTIRLHREDVRAMVDAAYPVVRHEDTFGCPSCGSPDPARIDTKAGTCSDCWDQRKATIDAAVLADPERPQ